MYKYYDADRSQLTIRLESAVPQNHLVRLIDSFVNTIPLDDLPKNLANNGRPAYHPALLLKILLFAYSGRTFSGRKIELMLQENLPRRLPDKQKDSVSLAFILALTSSAVTTPLTTASRIVEDPVSLALSYIYSAYYEKISLEDLTRQACINRVTLNQLFKDRFGCTAMEYLSRYWMEIAAQMLTHTGMKVVEIAEAVGFDYDTYFIRIFTVKKGMSPTSYRQMTRQAAERFRMARNDFTLVSSDVLIFA